MLKLQIVYENGEVVKFPAGGSLEADLINLIATECCVKDMFHIGTRGDLTNNVRAALYKFKSQILSVPVKI